MHGLDLYIQMKPQSSTVVLTEIKTVWIVMTLKGLAKQVQGKPPKQIQVARLAPLLEHSNTQGASN